MGSLDYIAADGTLLSAQLQAMLATTWTGLGNMGLSVKSGKNPGQIFDEHDSYSTKEGVIAAVKAVHDGVEVDILESCEGGSHFAHGREKIVLIWEGFGGNSDVPIKYVRGDGVVRSTTFHNILSSEFTGMGTTFASIEACLRGEQPPARLNVSKALEGGVTSSGYDSRGISLFAAMGFSLQDPTMDFHVSHDSAKFELQTGEGVQYQFRPPNQVPRTRTYHGNLIFTLTEQDVILQVS